VLIAFDPLLAIPLQRIRQAISARAEERLGHSDLEATVMYSDVPKKKRNPSGIRRAMAVSGFVGGSYTDPH
jgi:hypothetical protein